MRSASLGHDTVCRYTFEAIGSDNVVTLEVHNEAAFEKAISRRAVALTAAPLPIEAIKAIVGNEPLCVISPDLGWCLRPPAPRAKSSILNSNSPPDSAIVFVTEPNAVFASDHVAARNPSFVGCRINHDPASGRCRTTAWRSAASADHRGSHTAAGRHRRAPFGRRNARP